MNKWRANSILALMIFIGFIIMGRLFYLQIMQHDIYRALAKGQQKFFTEIQGARGEILCQDKKGNLYPLAINENWTLVYASPQEIVDKEKIVRELAQIIDLEESLLWEKLNENDLYELLKSRLSKTEIAELKQAKLNGIYLREEKGRRYPLESFAANLIGFVGGKKTGQYGIEEYWNETLQGKQGFVAGEKSSKGFSIFFDKKNNTAREGADLILSIDYNIQYQAEKLLAEAYENL